MSKKVESKIYEPFVIVGDGEYKERAVKYNRIESDIRYLTGKILTIIDASTKEESQNLAVKSLVKQEFSEFLSLYQGICFEGRQGKSTNL